MTDPSLRDALLGQDGGLSVEAELDVLNGLVEAEARRGRRLAFWTVSVWAVWAAMALAPLLFRTTEKAPEAPANLPLAGPSVAGPQLFVSGVVGVVLVAVGFLCLPAVCIVPLFLWFAGRRSASMSRIRTSLASIEAQLKLLTQTTKTPPAGPPG